MGSSPTNSKRNSANLFRVTDIISFEHPTGVKYSFTPFSFSLDICYKIFTHILYTENKKNINQHHDENQLLF